MIRETLLKILTEFETARKTGKFKGHLLASYIRNQAKQNFEQALGSKEESFKKYY